MTFIPAFTTNAMTSDFLSSISPVDVPRLPSYAVYISKLVRFARFCTIVLDFHTKLSTQFKTFDTGMQISQASKKIWKVMLVIL